MTSFSPNTNRIFRYRRDWSEVLVTLTLQSQQGGKLFAVGDAGGVGQTVFPEVGEIVRRRED